VPAASSRHVEQRYLISEVTARIAADLDLDSILEDLVDQSMAAFGADRALVSVQGPDGFAAAVRRGLSDAWVARTRELPAASLGTIAFAERRAIGAIHYAEDPRGADMRQAVLEEGFDSLAVAPLIAGDEVLGFLALYHDQPRGYGDGELETLLTVAHHGAIAIRHARDFAQLAKWAAQIQSIQALGARLGGLRTVGEIAQSIVTELDAVIECHNVRVYRIQGDDVVPIAMLGRVGEYENETPDGLRVKLGQGITGWVAEHGIPQCLGNAAGDPRARTVPGTEPDLDESMLLAPMVYDGRVLGVIVLSRLGRDQFGQDDLRLLEIFASFAAGAMANADSTDMKMRESEARLRAILGSMADAVISADQDGRIVAVNGGARRIFGFQDEEVLGEEFTILVPERHRQTHRAWASRIGAGEEAAAGVRTVEVHGRRLDGEEFPAEVSFSTWTLDGRRFVTAVIRDITERRRAQAALRASEAKYRDLVEHVPATVYTAGLGPDGPWRYVSPRVEELLGFPAEAWVGDPGFWWSRVHPEDRELVLSEEKESWSSPLGHRTSVEYRLVGRDGEIRWVSDDAAVVHPEDGSPAHWSGFLTDVTDRKILEDQLQHQAFHDPLTGLANRALFADRVEHALARSGRSRGSPAVLFLDLDDFKTVNDGMGHDAGDALLIAVAEAIQACLRPMDTASRLGGDEFAILIEDVANADAPLEVAHRIQAAVARPFEILGREIFTNASIGIARPRSRRERAVQLLRNADSAMYAAKRKGKGRCEVYEPSMHAAAVLRLELDAEIRRGLAFGEFETYFQPIVSLRDGRISGFEALVRWNHPRRGLVLPAEFIPTAEETGQIVELGRMVLVQACQQARAWHDAFPSEPGRTMSVNVSARQFRDPVLARLVEGAVIGAGLDPTTLILEITESVLMEDSEASLQRLRELKDIGVRIAIDDFGTGYSSLSYLRRLPVDILKVDKSFIDGIADSGDAIALAGAVFNIGRTLQLSTVAEGVEHASQTARLLGIGCDEVQGFHYWRPMPATEVGRLLRRGGARHKVG
jgi:diguanylate cyclase (GGDEF)-like protein/PAS domain S-box-containing protein